MPGRRPRGGLVVGLGLDASQFDGALARSRVSVANFARTLTRDGVARLSLFGDQARRVGATLTRSITLPLGLAAAAATKFALDYETGLTRVSTLTGVARSEVELLGDSLIDVSNRSSVALDELTGSLLVAVSAGFRGTEALELTESAARLTSIGFGELADITRALTVTVENYGAAGISAARASDILLATAQQGNFDVTQLADVFGRLLANANALGVPLESIAANFASLTRATGSATESQTQLSAILIAFLKPAESARGALAQIGLTVEEVRSQLADDGLYPTLLRITRGLSSAGIDLSQVFGRAQALAGVQALTSEASTVPQVLEGITASVGEVDRQYSAWAETSEGQLRLALANARNSIIELGQEVLPLAAGALGKVSGAVTGLTDAFDSLTPSTRRAVLTLAGLTAAAPLALSGVGRLTKGALALRAALIAPTGLVAAIASPIGLTAGILAAGAGVLAFQATLDDSEPTFVTAIGIVDQLTAAYDRNAESARLVGEDLRSLLELPVGERSGLSATATEVEILTERLEALRQARGRLDIFDDEIILAGRDQLAELVRIGEYDPDRLTEEVGSFKTRLDDELAKQFNDPQDFDPFRGLVPQIGRTIFASLFGGLRGEGEALLGLPAFQEIIQDFLAETATANSYGDAQALRRAQERTDAIVEIYLGAEEIQDRLEAQVREVLPALFQALDRAGDTSLRSIVRTAELTGAWDTATIGILELADAQNVQIESSREQIDTSADFTKQTLELVNAINARNNATSRTITAERTLRAVLGLDEIVLEGEEALTNLVASQAQAALLTAENDLFLDPETGFLDEYQTQTIDAIQAWFADIDRYAQSLGRGGEFSSVERLIGEQLVQLAALEDSLPESTYRRLTERLEGIRRSALEPDATRGGTSLEEEVAQSFDRGSAVAKGFIAGYDFGLLDPDFPPVLPGLAEGYSNAEKFGASTREGIISGLGGLSFGIGLYGEGESLDQEAERLRAKWEAEGITIPIGADVAAADAQLESLRAAWQAGRFVITPEIRGIVPPQGPGDPGSGVYGETPQERAIRLANEEAARERNRNRETEIVDIDPEGILPPARTRAEELRIQAQGEETARERASREQEERAIRRADQQRADARAAVLRSRLANPGGQSPSTLDAAGEELARIRAANERRAAIGFALGGIVTRPTLSVIGEAGEPEAVIPLSRAGEFGFGGGSEAPITINLYGNFYGDEEAFGDFVVDSLRTHTRLNGVGSIGA